MSDGRVMCYLLHYYHPSLLREEEICRETTQTCNPYTNEDDSIDDDSLNSKDESLPRHKGNLIIILWLLTLENKSCSLDIAFLLIIILFIDNYTSIYMIELIAIFNLHEL